MDNIKALYRKLPVICTVALLVSPLVFGEIIYENDFATRTSAVVVPTTEWHACDYVTDLLANTNGAAPFATPSDGQKIQDGWIKTADSLAEARVWAGTTGEADPAAILGHARTGSKQMCFVKQRIGNVFTSGTVTIQFDFQPPASWGGWGYPNDDSMLRRATLSFGDEAFYSPDIAQDEFYSHTAGSVGVALHGPDGSRKRKVYYNARQDFGNTNTTEQIVDAGDWLRAVVTVDLDARKWGFSMHTMGSHPVFDAATPASAVYATNNLSFADASVTSISSIALGGIGVFWSDSSSYDASKAPTYVARFDSIRIWHNGEACYENDFVTRRWRTFGGTASHTYVADCIVTNEVKNEVYVVEKPLVSSRENDGNTVQPIGVDGWRRTHNRNGTANAWVRSDDKGGPYLRFSSETTNTTSQAYLAQPFGSAISSGKVRLAVDARLPSKWDANGALWVTLADEQYYSAAPDTARNNYRWASVGIRGANNTPTFIYNSSGSACNPTPDGGITKEHWYRLVVTADLDARTTDFSVFEQGTSYPDSATADGTCIFATNGIGRISNISSLSCFSLGAVKRLIYFDNVKIWHIPTGSATETLLYENYFDSRTIYAQDTRVAPLVGTLELNREGQDCWTRVNNTKSGIFADWADGNPVLTFDRSDENSAIYAVQDLGQTVKNGTLTLQADIRPPKGWLKQDGAAYVRLGSDAHRQGPLLEGNAYFLNDIATGFGFKCTSAGKSDNLYTNSTIAAYRGDRAGGGAMVTADFDVASTNWYRFVATVDVSKSQYDVAVYDMGAEHPTLDTATPGEPPVATFFGLPFRRTKKDLGGISCVSASGYKTAQSLYDSSLEPMVDNIRVSRTLSGLVINIK